MKSIVEIKKEMLDQIGQIENILNLKTSVVINTPCVIKVNDFYTIGFDKNKEEFYLSTEIIVNQFPEKDSYEIISNLVITDIDGVKVYPIVMSWVDYYTEKLKRLKGAYNLMCIYLD